MVVFPSTGQPACTCTQEKMCPHPLTRQPHLPPRLLTSCFHLSLHLLPPSYVRVLPSTLTSPPPTDLISPEPRSPCPRPLPPSQAEVQVLALGGFLQPSVVSGCRADQPLCMQTVQGDASPRIVTAHQELCEAVIIPWLIWAPAL